MAKLPVIEIFGPTIQGEGVVAGLATYFVRFGGCDYRCSWCDSMFAVEPSQVKANAEKLTVPEIVDRLAALPSGPEWVTLSGGNPALLEAEELVRELQIKELKVAVETQGSRWREWLSLVDCLTVSPKPPSSGMALKTAKDLGPFMDHYRHPLDTDALKIVVFNEDDLEWAAAIFGQYPRWPKFLSVGTDPIGRWGTDVLVVEGQVTTLQHIADRYAWLCNRVAVDSRFNRVKVLPQLHVVAYGHARGV